MASQRTIGKRSEPTMGPGDWDATYRGLQPPSFDIGVAAPPLVRWLRLLRPGASAVVLGCGRGHDVRAALAAGWKHIVGVDYAPSALAQAKKLTPPSAARRIEWLERDVFTLGRSHPAAFDLVVEHTCFSTIEPAKRDRWRSTVERIVARGGVVMALFSFIQPRPGGPPFHVRTQDIDALFAGSSKLRVEHSEIPFDSVASRRRNEYLVLASRI